MEEETSKPVKQLTEGKSKIGIFSRTGMFGFELFMALFSIVSTVAIIDYGLFVLGNYIMGIDQGGAIYISEMTIWLVAAMIVWLPVTLFFYLRTSAVVIRNPEKIRSTFQKVLLSIYYFVVIVGGIGLMFAAVYSLIRGAIAPDQSMVEVLVRVVLPSVIAVAVHAGLMFAYGKNAGKKTRVIFASVFTTISVVMAVTLLIVSVGSLRAAETDSITEKDVAAITGRVSSYYRSNRSVPGNLQDLEGLTSEVKGRLSNYTYAKVDASRYTLCVDYLTDTTRKGDSMVSPVSSISVSDYYNNDDYKTYATTYYHEKGEVCYKLKVSSNKSLDMYGSDPIEVQ